MRTDWLTEKRARQIIQMLGAIEGWRFCFIGGVAQQRWGEPRLTEDVVLTQSAEA